MKTLGELEATIADYLERTDLEARIPGFITMAESKIYRGLRTYDSEFLVTITADLEADPPVDPISPITLPNNFKEMIQVTINDRPCEVVTDQVFREAKLLYGQTEQPDYEPVFCIINRQLFITPWKTVTPDEWPDGTTIVLSYYGTESIYEMSGWNTAMNPLDDPPQVEARTSYDGQSALNTTRLLQVAPDAYLYGALMEASVFLMNDARVPLWESMFSKTMQSLITEQSRAAVAGSTRSVSSVN